MHSIESKTGGSNWKRSAMFSAIAAGLTPGMSTVSFAQDQDEEENARLEEVIVTARKRNENIQDIPQSIQAFSSEDITKQGIKSLKDVAKFVPAMTVVGGASGLNKIIFRGLADSARPFIADSSAAIYLDEQPLTTGAQSPEVRPIDLERIETLAGPQGTLYGASSQSGTVRYITAKPDPSGFSANANGGLHTIHKGGTGWDADAMVNLVLVPDTVAIRLVGFGATDAGYIDNVLGNSPGRIDADTGERIRGTKTNEDILKKDINSSDWAGGRASIKWLVNDAWALTGIYNYSNSRINGYNDYDPSTGDLQTIKFYEEFWDDEWSNFQFTIDGDLGFAQVNSSTSYFERDTAYFFDGTSEIAYYHSVLGLYGRHTCGADPAYAAYNTYDFATACGLNGVGYDVDDGDPSGFLTNNQKDQRFDHETRLTGSAGRWDWTAGFFYQEVKQHWVYGSHIDDFQLTEAWAAYNALFGELDPTDIRWASSEKSKRKDAAVFGESTISLSEQWKLLVGARWYTADIKRYYTERTPSTSPVTRVATPSGKDNGILPKIGFQYFFEDKNMLYGLFSQGFRTGGINRARGNPTLPVTYQPDLLDNYEAGYKSQWLDGSLQFNITAYHQVWNDMQLELTDPSFAYGEPFQTVIANVGDAIVNGTDIEFSVLPAEGWELGVVTTYLFKAEIKDDIEVFDERDPDRLALDIPGGTALPLASRFNLSAFAEYDWRVDSLGGWDAYARVQFGHTGYSYNRLVDNDGDPDGTGYGGRVKQPAYSTWDLRSGFSSDNWEISLYLDNVFDERAVNLYRTNADLFWGRENIRTNQPRTLGFDVRYYFR
ncbi:MAG: TonB-dependent receptor [Xanthomonadales bacterium]|nr:TonB-dependent receptor [Xanthomonadales bacterium]